MIFEETAFTLRDGRDAILRSPCENDAKEMLQFIIKASGETDFLMKYPEEYADFTLEQDYGNKASFHWISVIRLPDFITKESFQWAVEIATKKKGMDCSPAEFMTIDEGLCVQIMHHGPYDDEPATVALMDEFLAENGYVNDFNETRLHHEIYMSDARKVAPEKLKTVIRHPIRRA